MTSQENVNQTHDYLMKTYGGPPKPSDWDRKAGYDQARCGSCSQHERVASLEGMLRRSQEDLCLALNGMHPEQGGSQGVLTCPHGVRAEGMTASGAVAVIQSLCGQCGNQSKGEK